MSNKCETNNRNPYSRTIHDPRLIVPGIGNNAILRDWFKHTPVRAASDGIRRDQASMFHMAITHHSPGFREPICHQIGFRGHTPGINLE